MKLVMPEFQMKFVKIILITFGILLLVSELTIYILLRKAVPLIGDADLQLAVLRWVGWSMLALFVVAVILCLITIYLVVKLTHHAVGPIPRLERELSEMVINNEVRELKVRKTDILYRLILLINRIIARK